MSAAHRDISQLVEIIMKAHARLHGYTRFFEVHGVSSKIIMPPF
jgi:hypothetical protein